MPIKIFNTLSGQKEEFIPVNPAGPDGRLPVNMYVCGITPYDETHLGHGRAYVTFDVVRRYLEYSGYKVTYVQNVTDVDDKIINKAQSLDPKSQIKEKCAAVVEQYLSSYFEVMNELNVRRADKYPKATEHIGDMIATIKVLVEKGFAYTVEVGGAAAEGAAAEKSYDVYFAVTKFPNYLKLSKRKLDDMEAGARVKVDERKKSPHDFALWKAAKPGEPAWDSPWGPGRPGWHIECSVMSAKYLGQPFDIHGGGRDLIFPHHENEIAQAEAATGKPFAKYWMHNGFVNINQQKMSKSLENFFALKDIFRSYPPRVVRFFLLKTHYRSPIDFSDTQLKEAQAALATIFNALDSYKKHLSEKVPVVKKKVKVDVNALRKKFKAAMDDDFNTAEALAVVFEIAHLMNIHVKNNEFDPALKDLQVELLEVLGIKVEQEQDLPDDVIKLRDDLDAARMRKDYSTADSLRAELTKMGYVVKTTPQGTILSLLAV
ncbi:MAG: cysteine--tRNA ligase [Candidatus Margulisiibacteriota bacterium]